MVGGATSGYCATGSLTSATRPIMTMTMDKTIAKMGLSMKNRDMADPLLLAATSELASLFPDGAAWHFSLGCLDRRSGTGAVVALDNHPFVSLEARFHG